MSSLVWRRGSARSLMQVIRMSAVGSETPVAPPAPHVTQKRNKSAKAAKAAAIFSEFPHHKDGKTMHPDLFNKDLLKTQYAVRGELYLKAEELRKAGREIIFTNVGNPHALGQKPVTFNRQVIALCAAPFLLDDPNVGKLFPADAVARARKLLKMLPGGIGAYSDSRGAPGIRQEVADYITARDGFPCDAGSIFLTDGASVAVRNCLQPLLRGPMDGILVPIPQYPLYSASIQLYGGTLLPYYLNEEAGWTLDMADMKRAVVEAREDGVIARGLVFINPGNPTGQCLSEANLQQLVKFAHDEHIVLMADEVYQENVYQDERPFKSCRKVLKEMGAPYEDVELLSFHTVSKGSLGECGLRGGYVQMDNVHPGAIDEVYKMASINLSPNVVGQVAMSLMVNPPQPGDPSYTQYKQERSAVIESLRKRAHMMTDAFNALEGVTCQFTEGAMYSFPQIRLPKKAVDAAKAAGKAPDVFYCLQLLETTGISTVPGSGFRQKDGTHHLRTTILPPEEVMMRDFVPRLTNFHKEFMAKYK